MQTARSASRRHPEAVADHIADHAAPAVPGEVYVADAGEHYDLAGSGGGAFVGAGFYAFDEDADKWLFVRRGGQR